MDLMGRNDLSSPFFIIRRLWQDTSFDAVCSGVGGLLWIPARKKGQSILAVNHAKKEDAAKAASS